MDREAAIYAATRPGSVRMTVMIYDAVVRAVKTFDLPDNCAPRWRLVQPSPLESLALEDDSGGWLFRCEQHGTLFSVCKPDCPTYQTVGAGEVIEVPAYRARLLVEHGYATYATREELETYRRTG